MRTKKQETKNNKEKVYVVSAHKLSDDIIKKLKDRFGGDLEIRIDRELIGGIRIRRGNDLYDNTVKSKLQNLKKEMIAA